MLKGLKWLRGLKEFNPLSFMRSQESGCFQLPRTLVRG
jgi:hypothetical protein